MVRTLQFFGMLVLLLSPCVLSARVALSKSQHYGAMPRHLYRQDCFQKRPVGHGHHQSLLLRGAALNTKNPGAGLGEIVPFETVLKDGFMQVACVKDRMFEHGDKFGDNKFSYSIGDSSNVSIVHYSMHVPKEDQEQMTHSACFAFCRTVPGMNFFGMKNGRECYCTPFYEMVAGDSSQCDAVCEGQPSTMCGGMAKSSIFSMHNCADTAKDLGDGAAAMDAVQQELTEAHTALAAASDSMQRMAESFQTSFGTAGDPAASDNMQSAKVFAGEVQHAAEAGEKITQEMTSMSPAASGMASADFNNVDVATDAEKLVANMAKATLDGKLKLDELNGLEASITPDVEDETATEAAKEYYSLMYFVDKDFVNDTSTCAGEAVGKPMVGSYGECAAACDAEVHTCVGFSYYSSADSGLCFLFSRFTSATYYTACPDKAPKIECAAKLSAFVGQTLKPDGSGECKQCLKDLTKADRCPK